MVRRNRTKKKATVKVPAKKTDKAPVKDVGDLKPLGDNGKKKDVDPEIIQQQINEQQQALDKSDILKAKRGVDEILQKTGCGIIISAKRPRTMSGYPLQPEVYSYEIVKIRK